MDDDPLQLLAALLTIAVRLGVEGWILLLSVVFSVGMLYLRSQHPAKEWPPLKSRYDFLRVLWYGLEVLAAVGCVGGLILGALAVVFFVLGIVLPLWKLILVVVAALIAIAAIRQQQARRRRESLMDQPPQNPTR